MMNMPPDASAQMASNDALFRPLADPSRRAIFAALLEGPKAVKVITAELPITQSAVSQHLKILKTAGLVLQEQRGRTHLYAPNPAMLERLSLQFGDLRDRALGCGSDVPLAPGPRQFDAIDSAMEHWAQSWPEHDGLSVGIIVRLRLIARHLESLSEQAAARYDLNSAQVLLLATLDRPETPQESTLTEMSQICHLSLPTTSRHIERLDTLGMITRRQDPRDRRAQLIRLTEAGRQLIHQILCSQREREHSAIYRMPIEDRLHLASLLRPLLLNLQHSAEDI